jgi:hypothetical protein
VPTLAFLILQHRRVEGRGIDQVPVIANPNPLGGHVGVCGWHGDWFARLRNYDWLDFILHLHGDIRLISGDADFTLTVSQVFDDSDVS